LAPIWMHVSVEKPELVLEPLDFGQLLLTVIVDDAKRYLWPDDVHRSLAIAGDRYLRDGGRTTLRTGAGLKSGWGNLDLAREVSAAAPSISMRVTAAAVASALANLFKLIHSNGPLPVVVVDDSDHFLRVHLKPEDTNLFSPFVTRVLPWLAALRLRRDRYRQPQLPGAAGVGSCPPPGVLRIRGQGSLASRSRGTSPKSWPDVYSPSM
jgi:hypothetical protein